MTVSRAVVGFLCFLLSFAVPASAVPLEVPGVTVTGGGVFTLSGNSVGWDFTTNQRVTVTALGMYDIDLDGTIGNGLAFSHTITLYSAGTILTQVNVPAGTSSTLIDGFRYASIAPIVLPGGQTYRIGTYFFGGDRQLAAENFSVHPALTLAGGRIGVGNVEPTIPYVATYVLFGPNLLIQTPELDGGAAPLALTLAFMTLALLERRRRTRATCARPY